MFHLRRELQRNYRWLINGVCLLALCLVSGTWAAPIANQPETKPEQVQLVSLRFEPCGGRCPVYRVEVYATGEVLYFADLISDKPSSSQQISQSDWQRILDAFNESHFDRLQPEYTAKEHGCRVLRTDASALRIELVKANSSQRLKLYTGCEIAERTTIMWLADTIAGVSGARDWWRLHSQQGPRKRVE